MTGLKIALNMSDQCPKRYLPKIGLIRVALIFVIPFCGVTLGSAQPVAAEAVLAPVVARTEQGQTLYCQPNGMGPALNCNVQESTSTAPQPASTQSPTQSLDGASDMLLKLLYLGLPLVILAVISLRSLHQNREIAKKRAFLESLERIWERSAQY
jgi:hypothetical protein